MDQPAHTILPLEIVQAVVAAASIVAVERGLGHAHAEAVARVEAEELEPSAGRVPVDQVEIAVVPAWSGNEFVAVAVDAEHEVGKAEIPGEAHAQLVVDQGHVEAHRGGGEAQTKRTGPLHGHVQALHGHHGGKRIAVAGGESTRGKGRAPDHEGRDRAEYSAGGRLVLVGMHHRGLVEQDDRLAHVAAADEEAGAVIHGGNTREGLEGEEDIGGSPGGRNHIQGRKGNGLLLPGAVGAGCDHRFAQLDEGGQQHKPHHGGIARGQVQGPPGGIKADEGGDQGLSSKAPGGKGEAAVPAGCCAVGAVDDLHVDKGHRPPLFVDHLSLDESPALRRGRKGEANADEESRHTRIHLRAAPPGSPSAGPLGGPGGPRRPGR